MRETVKEQMPTNTSPGGCLDLRGESRYIHYDLKCKTNIMTFVITQRHVPAILHCVLIVIIILS